MRCITSGLAVATAMAVVVRSSFAAESLLDDVLTEREKAAGQLMGEAAETFGQEAGNNGRDPVAVQVAEIQGMDESGLKLELRSLYSTSKDAQEKQIYPVGSLEAMQEILNRIGSVDEHQRDVNQFMNRFAFLVAGVLDRYNDFFTVKVTLANPDLSKKEYKKEVAKLAQLAAKWTEANKLLVAYLNLAGNDLRDKWGQSSTTDRRLREFLGFVDHLIVVYEAQQELFERGYALALLRYMEFPDRQADLTALLKDPRQKQAIVEFEDTLENLREMTHQARKAAAHSVQDGILASEYLMLLPFPADKQREDDDLPDEDL